MKKDPRIFLDHILESIQHIKNYIVGQTYNSFKQSIQLQDSLIRRLEIIGEAIKDLVQAGITLDEIVTVDDQRFQSPISTAMT